MRWAASSENGEYNNVNSIIFYDRPQANRRTQTCQHQTQRWMQHMVPSIQFLSAKLPE